MSGRGAFTPEQQAYVDAAIAQQFDEAYGSLFSVGQPPTTALATPTGFGLVEIEQTEAAPKALNASTLWRVTIGADVANATQAFVTAGLTFPVTAGRVSRMRAYLYIGGAAGATGGVQFALNGVGISAMVSTIKAPLAQGTWNLFPKRAVQLVTQQVCTFDMSAGADGYVEIVAAVVPSATGTMDLQFQNAVAAQNLIVRLGSFIEVVLG